MGKQIRPQWTSVESRRRLGGNMEVNLLLNVEKKKMMKKWISGIKQSGGVPQDRARPSNARGSCNKKRRVKLMFLQLVPKRLLHERHNCCPVFSHVDCFCKTNTSWQLFTNFAYLFFFLIKGNLSAQFVFHILMTSFCTLWNVIFCAPAKRDCSSFLTFVCMTNDHWLMSWVVKWHFF